MGVLPVEHTDVTAEQFPSNINRAGLILNKVEEISSTAINVVRSGRLSLFMDKYSDSHLSGYPVIKCKQEQNVMTRKNSETPNTKLVI